MDELELQNAVQFANDIIEQNDHVALTLGVVADPSDAARRMRCLADAVMKLGGGTVRPRTRTIKGPALRVAKPKP